MKLTVFTNKTNRRLAFALVCYAILAAVGAIMLDGMLRAAVLCFFAILAIKTVVHSRKDPDVL
jgi:hypothetical protein